MGCLMIKDHHQTIQYKPHQKWPKDSENVINSLKMMSLGPALTVQSVCPLSRYLRLQFQCPRKNSYYGEPPWLHNFVKNMACPCASPRSARLTQSSYFISLATCPGEKIRICRGVDVRNAATKDAPEVTEWALITVSWTHWRTWESGQSGFPSID